MSLKQRNGTTDLAAKMADLQVKDVEQPLETVPERSEHALPTATFASTFKTHDPQLTPIFGLNSRNRVDVSAKIAALRATRTSHAEVLDKSELVNHPHTTAHAHIEARAKRFESKLFIFGVARVLKEDPSELMLPIYGFTAPPREDKSLEYLSEEFWQVLDQCREADAASKILETELHGLSQERRERLHKQTDEYFKRMRIDQILESMERRPQEDTADVAAQPIIWPEDVELEIDYDAEIPAIRREKELRGLIEKARRECTKHETELNNITWDLMMQRGLIPASMVARVS
jgi:hypothetical protein